MKTLVFVRPALVLALAVTAFGQTAVVKYKNKEEEFLIKSAEGGMAEVELGTLAAQKATNREVKAFGEMMVSDHGKANAELKSVATLKGVKLLTELDPAHAKELAGLRAAKGAAFDRAYVAEMVKGHRETVKAFEQISTGTTDVEIRAFAVKTLPMLKAHLAKIEELQRKVK